MMRFSQDARKLKLTFSPRPLLAKTILVWSPARGVGERDYSQTARLLTGRIYKFANSQGIFEHRAVASPERLCLRNVTVTETNDGSLIRVQSTKYAWALASPF